MKSVKVKSVGQKGDTETFTICEPASLMTVLGIVPGSTLLCLAPGEELPQGDEGWETVYRFTAKTDGDEVVLRGMHKGDESEVRVRRAPKPKTAVLETWTEQDGKETTARQQWWRCSGCLYTKASITRMKDSCPNCGAHFTETKDL
jgi:hypothetical protein